MEFWAQYKQPAWQKKRLEALQNAEFRCQACYCEDSTLHVHHKRYVKGRSVWEYDVCELAVLCESCHAQAHAAKDAISEILAALDPMSGLEEVAALIGGYCSSVSGPSFISEIDTVFYRSLNPVAFTAGSIAGSSMDSIAEKILREKNGENNGAN